MNHAEVKYKLLEKFQEDQKEPRYEQTDKFEGMPTIITWFGTVISQVFQTIFQVDMMADEGGIGQS